MCHRRNWGIIPARWEFKRRGRCYFSRREGSISTGLSAPRHYYHIYIWLTKVNISHRPLPRLELREYFFSSSRAAWWRDTRPQPATALPCLGLNSNVRLVICSYDNPCILIGCVRLEVIRMCSSWKYAKLIILCNGSSDRTAMALFSLQWCRFGRLSQ